MSSRRAISRRVLIGVIAQQAGTGDRAGALASITEAVSHYRELAAANPAAYLPNLATSLNNLVDWLDNSDQTNAIPAAWDAAIEVMVRPAARVELRTAWAHRLAASGEPQRAREQLHHAAADADASHPNEQPQDQTSIILTMRARQAVRALAQALGPPATDGLPLWTSTPSRIRTSISSTPTPKSKTGPLPTRCSPSTARS